ncbi:DUF3256 family protein [Tannerella forsythia]|uniref:DUF3256 family protein n=1 Tax=Tannerella forsythia TaxID=28112 RepID=A0A1D3UBD4_TANFO|nr:DUF3256 family protein [Tannerella forsythia]OLQ20756.1 hypothetical protein BGK60_00005 [Tannerella forsythia]SCQ17452.1 hypothetical protein TFUB20_00013 [Tannerella forsythia]
MKQLIISMLLAACTIVGVGAQDMAELFVKMPDEYTIGLEDAWRKDLVNLYRAGKEAKLQNMMQGASQLMKLTPDYLKIQTSGRSTVELRRLPLVNHTWIICMVTTVSAPVSDSRIHFFTTDWKPLPDDGLYSPVSVDDFLLPDVDTTDVAFLDVMAALDMDLFVYRLNEDAQTLTVEYTTLYYLDTAMRDKAKQFFKTEPKVFTWAKGRFE